jgi:hypothetical protein
MHPYFCIHLLPCPNCLTDCADRLDQQHTLVTNTASRADFQTTRQIWQVDVRALAPTGRLAIPARHAVPRMHPSLMTFPSKAKRPAVLTVLVLAIEFALVFAIECACVPHLLFPLLAAILLLFIIVLGAQESASQEELYHGLIP